MVSWRSIVRAFVSVGALLALTGCESKSQLPEFGQVTPFALTDQTNAAFDSASLAGKVWVADFMFTTCPGPCPRMTSQMNQIRMELEKDGLELVSFTVDPEHDTPEVLAEYAAQYKAPPRVWHFLTGAREQLNHLGKNVFKVNAVDGSLEHSTRFMLVDRQGRIRGFYATLEPGFLPKLLEDARGLLAEAS